MNGASFIGRWISDHEQPSGSSRTEEELLPRYGSAFREWPRPALYGGGRGGVFRRMPRNGFCRWRGGVPAGHPGAPGCAAHRARREPTPVLRSKLMVGEEPVSALDVSVGAQVLLLLQELQQEFGLTYIFISHSLPVVAQVATRVAVMRAGKFVETGAVEQILHRPAHPYTR